GHRTENSPKWPLPGYPPDQSASVRRNGCPFRQPEPPIQACSFVKPPSLFLYLLNHAQKGRISPYYPSKSVRFTEISCFFSFSQENSPASSRGLMSCRRSRSPACQ